MTTPINLPKN
jgi:hypothetical protein